MQGEGGVEVWVSEDWGAHQGLSQSIERLLVFLLPHHWSARGELCTFLLPSFEFVMQSPGHGIFNLQQLRVT